MPSSPEPSSPQRPSLGRSAATGLLGGLLLGGLGLLAVGLSNSFAAPSCDGLTGPECQLLTDATREVGRTQLLAGGALTALAASLFVLFRPRPPAPPEGPEQS
ncbi:MULTISPECIES: hypothetical protein [Myxococcus]|uniref:hypothetical protein n=1 Tax=Myxococcus TaxID=32 RepID=UPI0011469181|nr:MULTISPECIES: hypothetical protein [Myxococcus]QQR45808.1 hypothetical protein JKA73_06665 [Myxococcus xanthus]